MYFGILILSIVCGECLAPDGTLESKVVATVFSGCILYFLITGLGEILRRNWRGAADKLVSPTFGVIFLTAYVGVAVGHVWVLDHSGLTFFEFVLAVNALFLPIGIFIELVLHRK